METRAINLVLRIAMNYFKLFGTDLFSENANFQTFFSASLRVSRRLVMDGNVA